MAAPELYETIEQQDWTDAVGDTLQRAAEGALAAAGPAAQPIADALHGVWLGHPLHPVLTDIPVGAWTATAVLDVADAMAPDDRYAAGADGALAVGLVGAMGAAVTGINDWRHTDGRARKIGVVHASLNGGATLMYVASLLLRRRGQRAAGRTLGFLGFATVCASAYLGGHLVYGERIGVDQTAGETPPEEFTPVLAAPELEEGAMRKVEANDMEILLARQEGRIHALSNTCSHLGCSLVEGTLKPGSIQCPCHGSEFALEDGRVLSGPSTYPQPCLQTRVRDGQIEVRRSPVPNK